jgi:hypothetical protein
MTAVLPMVLNLFVALTGPHGTAIYVAPSQVVAIIGLARRRRVPDHARYNEPARVCL